MGRLTKRRGRWLARTGQSGFIWHEAATVFDDPLAMMCVTSTLTSSDDEDAASPSACAGSGNVLVVSHTDSDDRTRSSAPEGDTAREGECL